MLHFSPRIIFLSWNSLRVIPRYRVYTCVYIYIYVCMYSCRCIFPLNPTYLPRASAFHEFHRGFYFFQSSILSYVSLSISFLNFFFLHPLSRIQSFWKSNGSAPLLQRNYLFHQIRYLEKYFEVRIIIKFVIKIW